MQAKMRCSMRCSAPSSSRLQARANARLPRTCLANRSTKLVVAATATAKTYTKATLNTLKTCKLGVSVYPIFGYDASSGGGPATVETLDDGLLQLTFDTTQLEIPSLNWRTATLFGVPIPPPLNIAINPSRLEGTVNLVTGVIQLEFDALFDFSAKPLYSAPSLVVKTLLTTESVQGRQRAAAGSRLTADGSAKLVGVATVEKVGDAFMDHFLMLPADALAIMDAQFTFE